MTAGCRYSEHQEERYSYLKKLGVKNKTEDSRSFQNKNLMVGV